MLWSGTCQHARSLQNAVRCRCRPTLLTAVNVVSSAQSATRLCWRPKRAFARWEQDRTAQSVAVSEWKQKRMVAVHFSRPRERSKRSHEPRAVSAQKSGHANAWNTSYQTRLLTGLDSPSRVKLSIRAVRKMQTPVMVLSECDGGVAEAG